MFARVNVIAPPPSTPYPKSPRVEKPIAPSSPSVNPQILPAQREIKANQDRISTPHKNEVAPNKTAVNSKSTPVATEQLLVFGQLPSKKPEQRPELDVIFKACVKMAGNVIGPKIIPISDYRDLGMKIRELNFYSQNATREEFERIREFAKGNKLAEKLLAGPTPVELGMEITGQMRKFSPKGMKTSLEIEREIANFSDIITKCTFKQNYNAQLSPESKEEPLFKPGGW